MAEEPQKASSSASQQPSSSSSDKKKPEDSGIKPQNPDRAPLYPGLVPQYDEQTNRGAGIYAVPVHHQFGALPANYLIPLTYNLPTTRPSNETEAGGENQAQAGQGQQQQQQQPAQQQRQVVVRRFEIAFQLDIFLILKLAAVIFLFNQDGSRQRLAVLVIFATIIYLYQTGALAPFVRWLSQGMHRAAVPPPRPQPPPAPRADNDPAAAVPLNGDAVPEGQENEGDNGNRANANGNVDAGQQGNQWWGIVKEIQMIVFGFITSLLPGFHNIE